MSWPTPQDFQEAMQNPRIALADPELQTGQAELDKLGLPRPISGGFASVYKVICPSRTLGVRCFLKECLDRQQRYAEISDRLAALRLPFATHFEFFSQGIRLQGHSYPVMKMEWVQGERLDRFVASNLQSPQKLLSLGADIVEIARALNGAGVAHGDLQHGNILVVNGKPKLIDYDGMYVPALQGWIKQEDGHPNYQLPRDDSDFGPNLDNFSVWVIYLSLLALSARPSLWKQFQGGDECLLFRRQDFEKPAQSPILQELKRLPEAGIGQFAAVFESLLALSPLQIPLIDPASPGASQQRNPSADWLQSHISPAPPQQPASAFSLSKQWAQIDQIPRPSDALPKFQVAQAGQVYSILQAPGAEPTAWPLPTTVPAPPAIPGILVSPLALPALVLPPARFQQSVFPVGSLQQSLGKVLGRSYGVFWCASLAAAAVLWLLGVETPGLGLFIGLGAVLVVGTWWGILELNRRIKQRALNIEYEQERKQREALQQEHECLREQHDRTRRTFDEAMAAWNVAVLAHRQEATRRREAEAIAKSNLQRAEQQWKAASEAAIRQFEKKKAELLPLKNEADIRREAELRQMLAKVRESHLNAHLSKHLIRDAAIANIGEKTKINLSDSDIRTALDVGRIINAQNTIPRQFSFSIASQFPAAPSWPKGVGDVRKELLVEWYRNVEATFVFRTGQAVPPDEMRALESKYDNLRQLIQRQLDAGGRELQKISQDAENQLVRLGHQIKACMAQLYQAEADLTVIPKVL